MGFKKFCYFFYRILFAITLILIGIKGILSIDSNKGYISQNIRIISEKILHNNSLNKFRVYCGEIICLQNILLILSSIFSLFGFKIGKNIAYHVILIELILVHNPLIYAEPYNRCMSSYYISLLFGIILNF
jgi:hypothetical protein